MTARLTKILAAVAVMVIAATPARASFTSVTVFSATVIAETANSTSTAVDIQESAGDFALGCIATGSGADIKVEYEASGNDGTTYDTTTSSPSRVIHSTIGTSYLLQGFDLPLARKVRFKATGQGANPADATVTCVFTFSER